MRALPLWVASAVPAYRQGKVAAAAARPRNDAGIWGDGETVAECVKNPGFRCAASRLRLLEREVRRQRGAQGIFCSSATQSL